MNLYEDDAICCCRCDCGRFTDDPADMFCWECAHGECPEKAFLQEDSKREAVSGARMIAGAVTVIIAVVLLALFGGFLGLDIRNLK